MGKITIRGTVVVFMLAIIGGYAFYESRNLLSGPIVKIESPRSGATSNSPVTEIQGNAKNIVKISMNDREISVNEHGEFNEKFVLSNGSNKIKVSAEDRFGRKNESFVEILYPGPGKPIVKSETVSDYQ